MEIIIILFVIMAIVLFIGMIGDDNADNRRNMCQAFVAVVLAIAISIIFQ